MENAGYQEKALKSFITKGNGSFSQDILLEDRLENNFFPEAFQFIFLFFSEKEPVAFF